MASEAHIFKELNAALKQENYTKAIEICNKIRSSTPNDPDAVKIKCIALIRTGKFDKALELAEKYDFLATERSYCLYRLQKVEEALKCMPKSMGEKSPALCHLEAQVCYRKGNYQRCIEIYEQLLSTATKVDDRVELQTNLLAAYVAAQKSNGIANRTASIETNDSFELCFNKALVAFHSGNMDESKVLLEEAERLCRETMTADGSAAKEIEDEVAVIRAQLALVHQATGNSQSALSMYREVLKSNPSNPAVSAVASNNIVTIRKDKDLFDSLKRLKTIDEGVLFDKLTEEQQEAILSNRSLLLCLMNKTEECWECLTQLKQHFPEAAMVPQIILLLAHKDQKNSQALEALEKDVSVGGRLALAHHHLAQGRYAKAAGCIQAIESIAHTPGTVATLVALYEGAHNPDAAVKVLENALAFHRQSSDQASSEGMMKLREGYCGYKIQQKKYQEAASAYLELLEGEQASLLDAEMRLRSLSSLVIALSYCDPTEAEHRCAMLPPVEENETDPTVLERSVERSSRLASKLADAADKKNERKRAAKNPERVARKRAKRREAYLAKLRSKEDYNPSIGLINPDPERWIPKKQRSHGKRGRRGRNRFVGAQGSGMGSQKDAMKLDAAARAAAKKAEMDNTPEEKRPVLSTSQSSAVQRKSSKKKKRR